MRKGRRGGKRGESGVWWAPAVGVVLLIAVPNVVASSWTTLLAVAVVLGVLVGVAVLVIRRLGAAYRRDALRRAGVERLDPRRFEELAAELLRRDGFRRVSVVGGAGDRGIDVVGVASDGARYAIQCKYYTRAVGPGQVRDFVGALQAKPYRDHRGVLITSHYLSAEATRTAGEHDLIVIDRDRLGDWLIDAYRLGPGRRPPAWLVRLRHGREAR
ncbi:restriction endonuclease [Planotetraspora thailandica]|uniref:restriction endonuclease n=1 Tax=Planotetraspora thailandica TaxID=487172 RepID=UPI00194F1883|nr:restriction endonuclease [Planotetraspora thailandica]